MSNEAINLVTAHRFASPPQKMIAWALANHCADTGRYAWSTFVGQEKLAQETQLGERTIRRTLKEFEDAGLIRRERRNSDNGFRTSDRIFLVPDVIEGLPATEAARSEPTGHSVQPTGHSVQPTGHSLAGEPSVEPQEEPSDQVTSSKSLSPLPASDFEDDYDQCADECDWPIRHAGVCNDRWGVPLPRPSMKVAV